MKVIKGKVIGKFKDGGTMTVRLSDGRIVYIDGRFRNPETKGKVFDRPPSLKNSKILNIKVDISP